MDFITSLLESKGCTTIVIVIDKLSKGVIIGGLQSLTVKALVK